MSSDFWARHGGRVAEGPAGLAQDLLHEPKQVGVVLQTEGAWTSGRRHPAVINDQVLPNGRLLHVRRHQV